MGYKIKETREALRMTQEELSAKSGVSRGTICALENGSEKTTTTRTLVKIAQPYACFGSCQRKRCERSP